MQRMNVDFPEPEGPKMTMTSPLLTSMLTPFNAWNFPYHFWTSRQIMIGSFGVAAAIIHSQIAFLPNELSNVKQYIL
jgi:hypothetical protein